VARAKRVRSEIASSRSLLEERDPDIKEMARLELEELEPRVPDLEQQLRILLLPRDPNDDKNILLEIRAGAGGDESTLFAADLLRMYTRFAQTLGWKVEVLSSSDSEVGGYK